MIRINLLPAELRRGNRIAPRVLAAWLVSALVASAALGWLALVYFGDLGQVEADHASITSLLEEKQKRVAYYEKLEANRQDYTNRVQTIQDIGKSRRLWSKFLDELIDVTNNNGDTDRHLAWFESLTVQGDARRGVQVALPGYVQGADFSRVANLHEDIESGPFAHELQSKSNPQGRIEIDKSRMPSEAYKFSLQLNFLPTSEVKPVVSPPPPAAGNAKDKGK